MSEGREDVLGEVRAGAEAGKNFEDVVMPQSTDDGCLWGWLRPARWVNRP